MSQKIIGVLSALVLFVFAGCSTPETASPKDPVPSTIIFADGDTVSKAFGSGIYTNAVSGEGNGPMIYISETQATATVNTSTGAVTIVGLGSTVITVMKAATATHMAVTGSYVLTVTKAVSTIDFTDGAAVTRQLDSGNYINTISGIGTGPVTYSSGDEAIASVDPSTGTVTLIGVGNTEITAVKAETSTHAKATSSYVLTITKIPSTIIFTDTAPDKVFGSGVYLNTVAGVGNGTLSFSSENTGIATVDPGTGHVTLVAVGNTVITVQKASTATHASVVNSYVLTVSPIPVTFLGSNANGTSGSVTTTELTLSFSVDPFGLIMQDITLTGGSKVALSGSGVTRILTVTNLTVGNDENITVSIRNPANFIISPAQRNVIVYHKLYSIGNTGPSGVGLVFHISNSGLHGLEVAPKNWNGTSTEPTCQWATEVREPVGLQTIIGSGYENTYTILSGTEYLAAAMCRNYTGGGLNGWYLPSLDEFSAMYLNLVSDHSEDNMGLGLPHAGSLGDFLLSDSVYAYWTSSISWMPEAVYAFLFYDATQENRFMTGSGGYVRPVRAF